MKEIARRVIKFEAEEFLDLRAGDENGDAVGKADDYRAGKIFDGRAHAGDAENDQENAGHHGAEEEPFDAVFGDDARDNDHEGAGGTADLRLGAAERGDNEAGDDGAVEAGLRRNTGGDGESHGERQSNEADGDARGQIMQKFLPVVVTEK